MIILIDSFFPYKGGEPFLAKELEEASRAGIKVILYPLDCNTGELQKTLPEGVNVKRISHSDPKAIIFGALYTLVDPMFWGDIKDIIRKAFSVKRIGAALLYSYRSNYFYSLIKKDLEMVKDEKICVYSYWMHIQACIGSKLKKKFPNVTFISRAHGYDLYEFRASSGFLPGRMSIFKYADYIFPVSNAGANYLKDRYKYLDSSKVRVAYLGTRDHGLNPERKEEIRLVSCSNIIPVKRINLIIEALQLIKDLPITWIHYGTGSLLETFQNEASYRLGPNISFCFEGYVPNDDLMQIYAKTHITFFINVSESEGLPVSIMEAMSFGIPTIATDVGGTCEIVESGENGILVDKDVSPKELSVVIKNALTMSHQEYEKMRKSARRTWESKFNAVFNYRSFYHSISGDEV